MSRVSVIVTGFLPQSRPYLDLCIESIRNMRFEGALDVIVVSPAAYAPQYVGARTVSPAEPYTNAYALNYGAEAANANGKPDYYLFLNDDVICTRDMLNELVSAASVSPQFGMLMPMGNDQQMGRYHAICGYHEEQSLFRAIMPGPYKLDAIKPGHAGLMMNAASVYPPLLVNYDTLCMYAVLIPRHAWEKCGPFDPALNGMDDIDYSMRMRNAGFQNVIAFNSLCWHAGGVSADVTYDASAREKSLRAFNEKWGGA